MVLENNKQNERHRQVSKHFPVASTKNPKNYQRTVFHQAIRQVDWSRDLRLYSRRRVIEPAMIAQLKEWVKNFSVESILECAKGMKRYEVLER